MTTRLKIGKFYRLLGLVVVLFCAIPASKAICAQEENPYQASAILKAKRRTVLSSRIAGRLEKIWVQEGEKFHQGDRLALVDCALHQARRKHAEAELSATKATYESQRQLEALKAGSGVQTLLAVANMNKAQAQLEEQEILTSMCLISAPFDGMVVERKAQPFQSVDNGQPLLEIIDNTQLEIRILVPSLWLSWLKPGTPFSLQVSNHEKAYPARVENIIRVVDPASQLVNVTGQIQGSYSELAAGISSLAVFPGPPK